MELGVENFRRTGSAGDHTSERAGPGTVARRSVAKQRSRYSQTVGSRLGIRTGLRMTKKIFIDSDALAAATSLLLRLGATEVFVFGSATKGALRPGSDIDIAVRGLPSSVYFSAISRATDLLGRQVDLVDLDDSTPTVRYLLGSGELIRVA